MIDFQPLLVFKHDTDASGGFFLYLSENNTMKRYLLPFIFFVSIFFLSTDLSAQKQFKTDSVYINSDKASSIAVKGSDGMFLVIKDKAVVPLLHVYCYDTSFHVYFHKQQVVGESSDNT